MSRQRWLNEGGIFYPIVGEVVIHDTPGPGIWQTYQSTGMNDRRIGLVKVDDSFKFDYKVYNFGGQDMFEKIKTVWESDFYVENKKNLGIIYNGTKGTGKTVSAKLLCNKLKLPVILLNHTYDGMILDFIQSLEFECIIFIDEAEKTFTGSEQEILLKMIDGVYNKSRKLYILTTNTLTVNENLISRPGRIRYIQEFGNLSAASVNEYIDDNLIDKSKKDKILEQVDLLEISTIDILKALVDEVNILGDIDERSNLNIPKARYCFDVLRLTGVGKDVIPQVKEILKHKPADKDLLSWLSDPVSDTDWIEDEEAKKSIQDGNYTNDDLFYMLIDDVEYSCVTKMLVSTPYIYRGMSTSLGDVSEDPDELKEPEMMVLHDRYNQGECLCVIVRLRNSPSLYGGRLRKYVL